MPALLFGQTQIDDWVNKTAAQLSAITDDQTESNAAYWNGHAYEQIKDILAFLDSLYISNNQINPDYFDAISFYSPKEADTVSVSGTTYSIGTAVKDTVFNYEIYQFSDGDTTYLFREFVVPKYATGLDSIKVLGITLSNKTGSAVLQLLGASLSDGDDPYLNYTAFSPMVHTIAADSTWDEFSGVLSSSIDTFISANKGKRVSIGLMRISGNASDNLSGNYGFKDFIITYSTD